MFTLQFYAARVLATLIASWGVWIPLVTMIYALPPLLQTPLFTVELSFWALIVTYINTARRPLTAAGSNGDPQVMA